MSLTSQVRNVGSCGSHNRPTCRPQEHGVLLVNVGTPDHPDVPSVRRYLSEFLADPLVIRLPRGFGWFNGILSRLIAFFRASSSAKLYRSVWTDRGSPLRVVMDDQAAALRAALPKGWRIYTAMRYGSPSIVNVLREIEADGIEELVVVPMYPQFSQTTTGTVIREVYRALRGVGSQINVTCRTSWYDDVGYVHAQARRIADWVESNDLSPDDTYLLFSAHGLPVSYVKGGDPYAQQIQRTVKLVAERLGWPADRFSLAFQSRFGPAEWLSPGTDGELLRLAKEGEKNVVICPVSFVADCLETLEELGIRYREPFEEAGGRLYLCPALNTYEPFLAALKNLVLHGSQPLTSWGERQAPLLKSASRENTSDESADLDLDSLVMIGVSLEGQIVPGRGPHIDHVDSDELGCVKKTHDEVFGLLKQMRDEGTTTEALVWNTCHRFEFYGWLADDAQRERGISEIRRQLFGDARDTADVNVLVGIDAWHHLMRTICGLNSRLPNDADIIEQFYSAQRLAEKAGVLGSRAKRLAAQMIELSGELGKSTVWGEFKSGYCHAALSRVFESASLDPGDLRHVILGGSSTSCSVLNALFEKLDVSRRQTCLVYRNHGGGQIKVLRRALGNGKRLRVNSYSEKSVIDAVGDSDVLILGIDRDEPVITEENLRGLRDFTQRPLTIIDFNTLGSVRGVEAIPGVSLWPARQLEREVEAYARRLCADERFESAVDEAEDWIERHLPPSGRIQISDDGVLVGSASS
ncbi:MAG: ferrochelatase [Planctomycetes bacterium]|nr:ferrochelatase [Planctomycetota bacterium]